MDNPTTFKIDYNRQDAIFNPDYDANVVVTIVGVGNIGSHTAHTLTRLGIKSIRLFDHDIVEIHNLSSQHYGVKDLGKHKAIQLAEQLQDANPELTVIPYTEQFTGSEEQAETDILIVAVDTMSGRKEICANLIKNKVFPKLIIDCRIGGAQIEVYAKTSPIEWQKTFVDNPAPDPCGGRFICYVSVMAGSLITNQVRKFLKQLPYDSSLVLNVDTLEVIKDFEW